MDLELLKKAGNIHNQVEKWLRNEILNTNTKLKLYDTAEKIENKIRSLGGEVAFPTGLSINNCAAHFTPNPGDENLELGLNDLIKIDYGVHVNGYIVDGAFSFSHSDRFDKLIEASQIATQEAIKMSGPDALLCDIGANTQEIIESYGFKSIRDLCGHQIGRWRIHSGKVVPNVKLILYKERMRPGEEYAIETFPTTGTGELADRHSECSHYMVNYLNPKKFKKAKKSGYNTLAFCKRWKSSQEITNIQRDCKQGILVSYPPRYDIPGSYVSQTEKSIYITEKGCEIL